MPMPGEDMKKTALRMRSEVSFLLRAAMGDNEDIAARKEQVFDFLTRLSGARPITAIEAEKAMKNLEAINRDFLARRPDIDEKMALEDYAATYGQYMSDLARDIRILETCKPQVPDVHCVEALLETKDSADALTAAALKGQIQLEKKALKIRDFYLRLEDGDVATAAETQAVFDDMSYIYQHIHANGGSLAFR